MKSLTIGHLLVVPLALALFVPTKEASAQSAATTNRIRGPQGPQIISPELAPDRRATFRILATNATSVRLAAGDIPGNGPGAEMKKDTNGVWEVTIGPIDPGAYRYNFNVDGVDTVDPRNPSTSESNNTVWSLIRVPGSDFMDTQNVPHGAVAAVTYYSTTLQRFRRMHVYTPPGYDLGKGKYPVFYLLHGAGDSDDSWTSVGRAGIILDNLIASRKAKPMIVVMPAGHTRASGFGSRGAGSDEFAQDFLTNIVPYVETHYRARKDQQHRAIAGLSMGGGQTLNIAIPHLDRFAYVGVFSSGLFGAFPRPGSTNAPPPGPTWEERNRAALGNAKLKKGLKLLWFSTGKDDFLIETTRGTVALLRRYGFNPAYTESTGGHTWINWRNYLNEFAPQLFQ